MNEHDSLNTRLTASTLDEYFAAGGAITLHVLSDPFCQLVVRGTEGVIELWTPADGAAPEVTALNRLQLGDRKRDGRDAYVLTAQAQDSHYEAYSLLASIVDDLAKGMSLRSAVSNSVATYRELLARRGRLSDEKIIGLLGELYVLDHLVTAIGEGQALDAWVGPSSEEHDFVLPQGDFEVKSTTTERRRHVIGTETQLQSTGSRPLWLLSLQFTNGGNADEAFTLPEMVAKVRARLDSDSAFTLALRDAGYSDDDSDLYRERFLLRDAPAAYLVDDDFPAITRADLAKHFPRPDLIGPVTYRVDVTSMTPGTPPSPMDELVKES